MDREQCYFIIDKEAYFKKEEHLIAVGINPITSDNVDELSYEACMTLCFCKVAVCIIGSENFQKEYNTFSKDFKFDNAKQWLRIIDAVPSYCYSKTNPKPRYLYDEQKFPKKEFHFPVSEPLKKTNKPMKVSDVPFPTPVIA
jgi:hypothetical protein